MCATPHNVRMKSGGGRYNVCFIVVFNIISSREVEDSFSTRLIFSSTAYPVNISFSKVSCKSTIATSATLFGVSYDRHTVVNLKIFLDAISIPYKSSSTKRILVSTLIDFEKSLSPTAQTTLVTYIQSYYDMRNTSVAARVERNLQRTLRRLSQEQDENNQKDPGDDKARTNTKSAPKSENIGPQKRKYSRISKGPRKTKKGKPNASKFRECSVCYESLPIKDFPKVNITTNCEHDNSVCTVCIRAHVDARVDIGQFGFITCPMCPEELVLEDVRRLCVTETFEKFVAVRSYVSALLI